MPFVVFDKLLLSAKVDDLELAYVDLSLLVGRLSTLDFDDSVFESIFFVFVPGLETRTSEWRLLVLFLSK